MVSLYVNWDFDWDGDFVDDLNWDLLDNFNGSFDLPEDGHVMGDGVGSHHRNLDGDMDSHGAGNDDRETVDDVTATW